MPQEYVGTCQMEKIVYQCQDWRKISSLAPPANSLSFSLCGQNKRNDLMLRSKTHFVHGREMQWKDVDP